MGKNKLKRFSDNLTFNRLFQPSFDEVFNTDYALKGNWHESVFKNQNPIVLELGCGKGEYTVSLAKKYPDKNFIGIDIKGARLWRGAKTINEENILNASFLRTRIDFITNCFAANEVSEIWITFPDPQIKSNRSRKRLTSSGFLEYYRKILKPDGVIHLKTDSLFLHEYTKRVLNENSFPILESFTDVYKDCANNDVLQIKTHYEQIFVNKGFSITYLKFKIDGSEAIKEPENIDFELI